MKVYLWGTGKGCKKAIYNLKLENIKILGIIDNNPALHTKSYEGYSVCPFDAISREFDYIIVTVIRYKAILYQLMKANVSAEKILCYYDINCWSLEKKNIFNVDFWKLDILEQRLLEVERISNVRLRNMQYEIAAGIQECKYVFPIVKSREEAVERIIHEKKSLIRFGDGEFEIMAGKNRPIFQKYDKQLSKRLVEVIQTNDDRILLAIANNYGNLDIYTDEVADSIREYMTDEVRKFHASVLCANKVYYDAYMFKCYFPYKNKGDTYHRVQLVKKIWHEKDVVIIEGDQTRTGVGNDLFSNVKSLRRVLCPTQNAYEYYEEILKEVLRLDKEAMILCALGPAGKVLAYDLVQEGYQVIDIGQIDMDYEWYLAGQEFRIPIENKYVSQLPPATVKDIEDLEYDTQIIVRIGDKS